jgi:hypothetical protein
VTTEERKAVGLLGIEWDDDFGIIDMKDGRVLLSAYANSRWPEITWYLPTIKLEDSDFKIFMPPDVEEDELWEYANWEHMYALLLDPRYDFAANLEKCTDEHRLSPTYAQAEPGGGT